MMSLTEIKSGPGLSVLRWYCQYGASSVGVPESYKSYAGLIRDDSVRWSITIGNVQCLSVSRFETSLKGQNLGKQENGGWGRFLGEWGRRLEKGGHVKV